jgi:N-dimethylarginine dimethylaminohydrolase
MRNWLVKPFRDFQKHVYHLGHGFTTESPDEAAEAFFRREFPEIMAKSSRPHDLIVIPEVEIFKVLLPFLMPN